MRFDDRAGSSSASGILGVDVLEAYLAAGDELVVIGSADLDLPQLLRTPLVDRVWLNQQTAIPVRAHEVGDVGDAP